MEVEAIPRYIAFLRAINVGRGRTVKMDALRLIFESAGYSGVKTFINSGNVAFDSNAADLSAVERSIEGSLRAGLGYEVTVFIRTQPELAEIAKYEPFAQVESEPAAELYVIFLSDAPDEKLAQQITALTTRANAFLVHGREIYWLRRIEPGNTVFSNAPLEKTLGKPFTIRSARTVKRIAEKF